MVVVLRDTHPEWLCLSHALCCSAQLSLTLTSAWLGSLALLQQEWYKQEWPKGSSSPSMFLLWPVCTMWCMTFCVFHSSMRRSSSPEINQQCCAFIRHAARSATRHQDSTQNAMRTRGWPFWLPTCWLFFLGSLLCMSCCTTLCICCPAWVQFGSGNGLVLFAVFDAVQCGYILVAKQCEPSQC